MYTPLDGEKFTGKQNVSPIESLPSDGEGDCAGDVDDAIADEKQEADHRENEKPDTPLLLLSKSAKNLGLIDEMEKKASTHAEREMIEAKERLAVKKSDMWTTLTEADYANPIPSAEKKKISTLTNLRTTEIDDKSAAPGSGETVKINSVNLREHSRTPRGPAIRVDLLAE